MKMFPISSSYFINFLGIFLSQEIREIGLCVQYLGAPRILFLVYTCGCVCAVRVWMIGGLGH